MIEKKKKRTSYFRYQYTYIYIQELVGTKTVKEKEVIERNKTELGLSLVRVAQLCFLYAICKAFFSVNMRTADYED